MLDTFFLFFLKKKIYRYFRSFNTLHQDLTINTNRIVKLKRIER